MRSTSKCYSGKISRDQEPQIRAINFNRLSGDVGNIYNYLYAILVPNKIHHLNLIAAGIKEGPY